MDCTNTTSLIDVYLQGKLAGKQKEQFLLHILNCPKCYEELDISFIVSEGIKGLDQDENMDFNFANQLRDRVSWEYEILKERRIRRIIWLLLILFVLASILGLLVWEGHLYFTGDLKGLFY